MKVRTGAFLFLLLVLLSSFLTLPPSSGVQQEYKEQLDVSLIGSSALWRITFSGPNVTVPHLEDAEGQLNGVRAFSLVAARVSSWLPEYEVYTSNGFDLIGFEPVPTQGVFLTVVASSSEEASRAASVLDGVFKLSFVPHSPSGEKTIFYSHADFGFLVNNVLSGAIPSSAKGFTELVQVDKFTQEPLAIITFSAQKQEGGFAHSVSISSIKTNIITDSKFQLSKLFASKVNASKVAAESTLNLQVINALVLKTEGANSTNDYDALRSAVFVKLDPGKPLPLVNLTLQQSFPSLVATRGVVNRGSVKANETMEAFLKLANLAPNTAPPIENVTVREVWWSPFFNRTGGDQTEQIIPKLGPGETKTLVFELRAVASSADIIQAPEQNEVEYSFKVGEHVFHRISIVNQVRISIGPEKPAVWLEVSPSTTTPQIGDNATLSLSVFNKGKTVAFNVTITRDMERVASIDKLLPDQVNVTRTSLTSSSITSTGQTLLFTIQWTEQGDTRSILSNSVQLDYRFDTPHVPVLQISKKMQISSDVSKMVNVTVVVTNQGAWRLANLTVKDALPNGIAYVNGSFIAVGQRLTATIDVLEKQQNTTLRYSGNLTDRTENFVIVPAEVSVKWTSAVIKRVSEGAAFPIGVEIQKQYSRTFSFTGASTHTVVDIRNGGSLAIFDVNLQDPPDTFLRIVKGNATASKDTLTKGGNLTLSYDAKLSIVGDFTTSKAVASFVFAGQRQSISSMSVPIVIYDVPTATLSIEPKEPVESKPFVLTMTIRNPSNLTISNLNVSISIPGNLEGTKRSLELQGVTLARNASLSTNASFTSRTAIDILIPPPVVKFQFGEEAFTGKSSRLVISVTDDIPSRYGLPISIALVIALLSAFYARRLVYRRAIKTP